MSVLFTDARILTDVNGEIRYLENAFLGVRRKTIDYIGLEEPDGEYSERISMYNRLLIPGLVNCHTHACMTLMRGLGSGLELQKWLEKMWAVEDCLREEDFENGMNLALLEMIGGGTTSFSDMYTLPYSCCTYIEQSGIKANLSSVMLGGFDEPSYENFERRIRALDFYKTFNNKSSYRA